MKKLTIPCILVLVLAASTVAGCGKVEEPAYQAHFEPAECKFEIPPGQTVECGYLTVPEDRSQPEGPTIRLHVAIFRTDSDNPAPDPVVYLAGGPGEQALEAMTF